MQFIRLSWYQVQPSNVHIRLTGYIKVSQDVTVDGLFVSLRCPCDQPVTLPGCKPTTYPR